MSLTLNDLLGTINAGSGYTGSSSLQVFSLVDTLLVYSNLSNVSNALLSSNYASSNLCYNNASNFTYITSNNLIAYDNYNSNNAFKNSSNFTFITSNNLIGYTIYTSNICINYNNLLNKPTILTNTDTSNISSNVFSNLMVGSSNQIYTNAYFNSSNFTFITSNNIISYVNTKSLGGGGGGSSPWITGTGGAIYYSGGNVGVSISNPQNKLHISANLSTPAVSFPLKLSANAYNNLGTSGTFLGLGTEDGSWSKCAIGHTRTNGYDVGDILFLLNNSVDSSTCAISHERMRITSGGYVGINNTNPDTLLTLGGQYRLLTLNNSISSGNSVYMRFTNTVDNNTCLLGMDGVGLCAIETGALLMGSWSSKSIIFVTGNGNERMRINGSGNVGINITAPACKLDVQGVANIHNGNRYAVPNNFMAGGSLTIGDTNTNYGFLNTWGANIAGLLMECLDNTEIVIHDAGNRLVSFMAYQGGTASTIYIGRTMGAYGYPIITFSGGYVTWSSVWILYVGTSPTGVANSFVFNHNDGTLNSKWWFNGTQASTSSEISDERIKKEVKEIDNPLEKIMKIKPKEYYLCEDKDYIKKYGIIAQDINKEDDLKHLIYEDEEYISNIYSKATFTKAKIGEIPAIIDPNINYEISSNNPTPPPKPQPTEIFKYTLTTDKNLNGLINIDDELKILLDNDDKNNLEIVLDDTPYRNRYKKRFVKVKAIIDDYTFEIYDDIELTEIEKDNLFVYGKKVNDFLKLDYSSLYSLNIKATQSIYQLIQQQQEIINQLKRDVEELKTKIN